MAWEEGRRLVTANGGGKTLSFTYDSDGLRLSKNVGSTTYSYLYAGGKLIRQTGGGNTLDFFYDESGHPYALTYNGTTYYYVTSLQGDVLHIVNGSGTSVVSYTYDPYGKPLTTTGSLASTLGADNPLRYRGYVYDQETGFYYLQSRYYDPTIGRFINADSYVSTGQGFLGYNMFAYCGNNPICQTDYTGTMTASGTVAATNFWNPAGWIAAVVFVVEVIAILIVAEVADEITMPQISLEKKDEAESEKGEVTSGDPPTEKDGYRAPKGGPKKGKTKDGKTGWVDKNGNIWVPAPSGSSSAHGGGHWDVQRADGNGYANVYPGGKIRPGKGKAPIIRPVILP